MAKLIYIAGFGSGKVNMGNNYSPDLSETFYNLYLGQTRNTCFGYNEGGIIIVFIWNKKTCEGNYFVVKVNMFVRWP